MVNQAANSNEGDDTYFLNHEQGPTWTSSVTYKKNQNTSYDLGESFESRTESVIFGSYFFLSDTILYHKVNRYTWLNYVSEMGGLLKSLSAFVGYFMYIHHKRSQAAHVMTNVYFKENSESKKFIAPTKFRKKIKIKVDNKSQEDIEHEGGDEDQRKPNDFDEN